MSIVIGAVGNRCHQVFEEADRTHRHVIHPVLLLGPPVLFRVPPCSDLGDSLPLGVVFTQNSIWDMSVLARNGKCTSNEST